MSLPARLISDPELLPAIAAGDLRRVREVLLGRINEAPAPDTLASLAIVELELGQLQSAARYSQQAFGLAPKSTLVLNTRGHVALRGNDLETAGKSFQAALAANPTDVNAALGLGAVLHRQRRFEEAERIYLSALTEHPGHADLHNQLGRAYNNQGKLLKAQQAFEQALAAQPDFAEAHHNLAHVKRRAGDLAAARKHFQQALALQPDYFAARYNLGTVYLAEENFAQAVDELKRALQLAPRHPGALCNLGAALFRTGNTDEAIELLEQGTSLEPRMPEGWVNLGLAYFEKGANEDSIEALSRAHMLDPADPVLVSHYASVLAHEQQGQEAATITAQLLGQPSRPLPPAYAADYRRLGDAMRFAGRLDLATRCYRKSVELHPSDAEGHLYLAAACVEEGRLDVALETIEQALQVRPRYQSAWALKATILQRLGRRDEAREILDLDNFVDIHEIPVPADYQDLHQFNATLVERVLAEPSLEYERSGHATRKGRHTGTLDIESGGAFRDLAQAIDQRCQQIMDSLAWQEGHPLLGWRPKTWKLQVWSVVMDSQGHQVAHTHDDGYLSGVYYPLLPDVIGDNNQQGWLEFGQPAEELVGDTEMMRRQIRPRAGRMVIFPSYFVHRTIPFESEQPRVSIAFDLRPIEWQSAQKAQPQRQAAGAVTVSEQQKIAFLEKFNADEVAHSEHNLIAHLDGVRQVLARWGEKPALCDAGLFHSVYGTESFPTSVLPHGLRERVRALIGFDAERLAWLFGIMRKQAFYTQLGNARSDYTVHSRIDNTPVAITSEEFTDLVRLIVANWFEQLPRVTDRQREQVRDLFLRMRPYLNPTAQTELDHHYPGSDRG